MVQLPTISPMTHAYKDLTVLTCVGFRDALCSTCCIRPRSTIAECPMQTVQQSCIPTGHTESHTLHSSIHTPPYLPAWGSVPGRVGSTCVHAVRPLPPPCTSAPATQRPLPAVAPPQQQPQAALRGSAHAHCADRHPTPSRSCRMKSDMSRNGFSRSDEGVRGKACEVGAWVVAKL